MAMDTHELGFVLSTAKPEITIQIRLEPKQVWIFDSQTRPDRDSTTHWIPITEPDLNSNAII
jgi:hypothetical protein